MTLKTPQNDINGYYGGLGGADDAFAFAGADDPFRATARAADSGVDVERQATAALVAGPAASTPFVPGGRTFNGGDGGDDIEGGAGGNIINGFGGDDNISGRGGRDSIIGGDGEDVIRGNAGADTLIGNADDDFIRGQRGEDLLFGGRGEDTLNGGAKADTIYGGPGADIIIGGHGNDDLYGGGGNDRLVGGDRSDRLEGGKGADFLIGGLGKDRFVFDDNFGRDRIADFGQGPDVLNFAQHSAVNSMADLTISARGGDTLIEDAAGNQIFLTGVRPADLDDADFIF